MVLVRALLTLAVATGTAWAQERPSVVKVIVTQVEGEPRIAAGFVTEGGFVVTSMGCIQHAKAVRVAAGEGEPRPASGVAAYQHDANVALLAVDWGGQAPPSLKIASRAPEKGTAVSICQLDGQNVETKADDSAGPKDVFRSLYSWPFSVDKELELTSGGAPLLDHGVVVGTVAGAHRDFGGVALDLSRVKAPDKRPTFDAARPEIIRALKPGEVIAWSAWGERQADMARAAALVKQADAAGRKNDTAGAIAAAQEAVKLDDRSWRAWRTLSYSLTHADEPDEEGAIAAADHAIALMPTESYAYTMKACILARQGNSEPAIATARQAIEVNPKDYMSHHSLGYCLQYAGDNEGAIAAYTQALKINPHDEIAKKELARLREYEGAPGGKANEPRF